MRKDRARESARRQRVAERAALALAEEEAERAEPPRPAPAPAPPAAPAVPPSPEVSYTAFSPTEVANKLNYSGPALRTTSSQMRAQG